MSTEHPEHVIKSAEVQNNKKNGLLDVLMKDATRTLAFSLTSMGAITVMNLLLMRLMQRQELAVQEHLQNFALQEIEALSTPEGMPYLKYKMENGLAFGSGLEHEKLVKLHEQLGKALETYKQKFD